MLRRMIIRAGVVLLVVVLLVLLMGQLLGQPIGLAYVETDSMEPAIESGEGYIALPPQLTGSPSTGDVVAFQAEEIEDGQTTTHRIVDETPEGYITQGDANPFTDQDGGEPPVTEDEIVADVLQVGGEPVAIPYLGTITEAIQSAMVTVASPVVGLFGLDASTDTGTIGIGVFITGLVLFVLSTVMGTGGPRRDISRSTTAGSGIDAWKILVVLLIIVLVPANAAMLLPGGTTTISVDGDEVAEAEEIEPGDPAEAEFTAQNGGLVATVVTLEPDAEDVTMDHDALAVPAGESATATASVPAPPPETERVVGVTEHRYLQLLPESLIVGLHDRSPYLALGVLNGLIAISVIGIFWGVFGFGRIQVRDHSRNLPLAVRLRRRLR